MIVWYFLDGNRPLFFWYILLRYSATTVIYGIFYILRAFPPACVWCCDASTFFTEHENHQTSNLNMKYSIPENTIKGSVQNTIKGRQSQTTGDDHKQELCPPMSIASSPDQTKRLRNLPPPYRLWFRTGCCEPPTQYKYFSIIIIKIKNKGKKKRKRTINRGKKQRKGKTLLGG